MKDRELDENDFLNLNTRYVKEETPGGEVIMSYNKDVDCFSYYTKFNKYLSLAATPLISSDKFSILS